MSRPPSILIVAFALAIAGCADAAPKDVEVQAEAVVYEPAQANETTGAIEGLVTDVEAAPIEGALAGLVGSGPNQTAKTAADGRFVINGVEPGSHKLFVQKFGYVQVGISVDVVVAEVTMVKVTLEKEAAGPAFPIELRFDGIKTQGGFFQVSYAAAKAALPEGFEPRPHVLADPNGQMADFGIFIMQYENGSLDGKPLPKGAWMVEALDVLAPSQHHLGSANSEFVIFNNYATDPRVEQLMKTWNMGDTKPATIDLTMTDYGASTVSSVTNQKAERFSYRLTTAMSQSIDSLTGGGLSVRFFAVQNKEVVNYVDLSLTGILFSLTGVSQIEPTGKISFDLVAPVTEGYMQWGTAPVQRLSFVPVPESAK